MRATPRLNAHIWLRHEIKAREYRTPLTPSHARELIAAGHTISVEKSPSRCFKDGEYQAAGCALVASESWPSAPKAAVVLGLKELPAAPASLAHTHVYFAHAFKRQQGWKQLLRRFTSGGGRVLDLEFLVDDQGVRVSSFSYMAGVVGAALGLMQTGRTQRGLGLLGDTPAWPSFERLVEDTLSVTPTEGVHVALFGGNGRAGQGARKTMEAVKAKGGKITWKTWEIPETAAGGPFWSLLTDYDMIVNCLYLKPGAAGVPYLTKSMLQCPVPGRRLSMLADISCDTTNPSNPFPFSDRTTSVQAPTFVAQHKYLKEDKHEMQVIAIDHLPSLLPRDSSENFSGQLLPHLKNVGSSPVWSRAADKFALHAKEANE